MINIIKNKREKKMYERNRIKVRRLDEVRIKGTQQHSMLIPSPIKNQ